MGEVEISSSESRRLKIGSNLVTGAAFAILLLIGVALAFTHPRYQITVLVGDDAGYYMAIARNYSLGYGYSFDRIGTTNGFNPLMPALLIGFYRVFAPNLEIITCFRIGTLITWLALVAGVFPFRHLVRRVLRTYEFPKAWLELAVASATFAYAGFIALKGYYGMDAFLVLGLVLIWMGRVSRGGLLSPGVTNAVVDGILLGAVVLARVDSLPLIAVAFALMLVRAAGGRGTLSGLLIRAAAFAVFVVPYFLWNHANFGDWLPISARLKTAFPHLDVSSSLNVVLHTSLNKPDQLLLFGALVAALVWCFSSMNQVWRAVPVACGANARDAMLVWASYLVIRLTWLLLFSRFDVQSSYFILAGPFFFVAVLVGIGRWRPQMGAALACGAMIATTILLIGGKLAVAVPQLRAVAAGDADNGWELARKIHNVVRADEIIFGGSQGLLGFIADRSWINGDGVANNSEFQRAKMSGKLAEYLECHQVTFVEIDINQGRSLPLEYVSYEKVLSGYQIGRHQTVTLVRLPDTGRSEASVSDACLAIRGVTPDN